MEQNLSEEEQLLMEYLNEEREALKSYSHDPTEHMNNDMGTPIADKSVTSLNDIHLNASPLEGDDKAIIEETDKAIKWLKSSITRSHSTLEASTDLLQKSPVTKMILPEESKTSGQQNHDSNQTSTPFVCTRPDEIIREVFAELSPSSRSKVLEEFQQEMQALDKIVAAARNETSDDKAVEKAEFEKQGREKLARIEKTEEENTETSMREQDTVSLPQQEERVMKETKDNFIRSVSADEENTLIAPFGTVKMKVAPQINSHKTIKAKASTAAPAFTRVKLREVDSKIKASSSSSIDEHDNDHRAPLTTVVLNQATPAKYSNQEKNGDDFKLGETKKEVVVMNNGVQVLTYKDLVRRSMHKDYKGLDQFYLEKSLAEEEFIQVFKMNREEFNAMPAWKRKDKKRKLHLF